jgi:hypothetical protein
MSANVYFADPLNPLSIPKEQAASIIYPSKNLKIHFEINHNYYHKYHF